MPACITIFNVDKRKTKNELFFVLVFTYRWSDEKWIVFEQKIKTGIFSALVTNRRGKTGVNRRCWMSVDQTHPRSLPCPLCAHCSGFGCKSCCLVSKVIIVFPHVWAWQPVASCSSFRQIWHRKQRDRGEKAR